MTSTPRTTLLAGIALLAGLIASPALAAVNPTSAPPAAAAPTSTTSCEPAPDPTTSPAPTADPAIPDTTELLSGTIRWVNASTWVALDDAGHTPTGIASVQVFPTYVQVNHAFAADTVSSLQATPDEQFAAAGVRVGASVGLTSTRIYFYMGSSSTPVNPALLSRPGANVWLTGLFDVEP